MTSGATGRDDDSSVDVEAAWADIVARWDEPPAPGHDPDPDQDAADAEPSAAADDSAAPHPVSRPPAPQHPSPQHPAPGAAADDDWDDWDEPRSVVGGQRALDAGAHDARVEDALDEGYVPPEPPPLPRGDTLSTLAWAAVLGAPVFFLVAALFWQSAPTLLVVGSVVAFGAGFVALVLRMPDRDDDGDDGAVV